MKVDSIVRSPESRTANLTVIVQSKNIHWQSTEDGKSLADLNSQAINSSSATAPTAAPQ